MNLIDILACARAEVMDEPEEVLREALVAQIRAEKPDKLPSFQKEIDPEKATVMLEGMKKHLSTMRDYAKANPEAAREMFKDLGVSDDMIRRSNAIYASHKLKTENRVEVPKTRIGRELFHQMGAKWEPYTWAYAEDDDDFQHAYEAACDYADHSENETLKLVMQAETMRDQILFYARWAHFAYPLVQLRGHKYAAALMSTAIPEEMEIKPPWKTFLVEVPEGLLFTENDEGVSESIVYLWVNEHPVIRPNGSTAERGWSLLGMSTHGVTLHRMKMSTSDLREAPTHGDYAMGEAFTRDLDSKDDRTLFLLSRLAINTCLAMSDPSNVRKMGKHHSSDSSRGSKLPTCRVFRVGKPIEVDCRPALHSYLEGERRNPLAVQFLVRGHWRNQACGPGLTERKVIWIEPYWKGPEDAPINVREHKLGGEKHD